jgi:hypothetical protein
MMWFAKLLPKKDNHDQQHNRPKLGYLALLTAIMSTDALQGYQIELLVQAEEVGALKFGEFTLKSGR